MKFLWEVIMAKFQKPKQTNYDYAFMMSHAYGIDESSSILNLIPCVLFSSLVIMMVRMETYYRPMSQFYWSNESDESQISDFFSFIKMETVLAIAVIALLMLLFRVTTQSLAIKGTWFYYPMLAYSLFVVLSYIFSDYKEFALLGFNDRFEGTLPLLAYMLIMFMIINSINTEKDVKVILYPLAVSSTLLSFIGISQAADHDFFRTAFGQKLIVPNNMLSTGGTTWEAIDAAKAAGENFLQFTFQNREIYQTVYNINYVSFYLTLLVPLFGMLFLRSLDKEAREPLWKKIALGIIMGLLVFNLIGSASSGGYLGIGVMGLMAIIIFNKQLLKWWKPLVIVFAIAGVVMAFTYERWYPELTGAIKGALGTGTETAAEEAVPESNDPASVKPYIDYFRTGEGKVEAMINDNLLVINMTVDADGNFDGISVNDAAGETLALMPIGDGSTGRYSIEDDRFKKYVTIGLAADDNYYYALLDTVDFEFPFAFVDGVFKYQNQLGYFLDLAPVERAVFTNNPGFGSGRGSIWAHSIPLLKKSAFIGVGADCYCAVYPHYDYAHTYSEGDVNNILLIVDKPHNMYLHAGICTGCTSLIAMLTLYLGYIIQSIMLFWKRDLKSDYLSFVGAGLFLGVSGFVVTGLVDDSTISVMPMFYTLLGMGIAVNMILKRRDSLGSVAINKKEKQEK